MKKNEDEVLRVLARAILSHYRDKEKSADDFESYAYGLRMKLALSDDVFQARFLRGFRVLVEELKKEPEEESRG